MRPHDCLTRAARIWPGSPATCDANRVRTWREIREEVARLAAGLRSLGVSPGDRIALLGANSDRYLVSFFAASWTGAVLVPLNTWLAESELIACLLLAVIAPRPGAHRTPPRSWPSAARADRRDHAG